MSVLWLALLGCEPELPPGECENADLIETWVDADLDGFGDKGTRELVCTLRDGLVTNKDDCDDQRGQVYPGALEQCDGIDNDCNGEVDEGLRELDYYQDLDGDGYGNYEETTEACTPPPGYVENFDDCNDLNASIHPLATEICNAGTDDNCNGRADDEDPSLDRSTATEWYYDLDDDGFGAYLPLPFPQEALDQSGLTNPFASCARPEKPKPLAGFPGNFVSNADDCDDLDPLISPLAIETCNLVDDDCDNLIDDSDPDLDPAELVTFWVDDDADGAGDPTQSVEACFRPWFTADNDEDCDDSEPLLQGPTGWWVDGDGDGFGTGTLSADDCVAPSGDHVLPAAGEDCDDASLETYPGAPEVCDGADNDCDGDIDVADEDLDVYTTVPVWRDADMDGFGDPDVETPACEGVGLPGFVDNADDCDDSDDLIAPDATERCNGIDDDCDDLIDTADLDVDLTTAPTWFADFDEDGWGNSELTVVSCEQPAFYVDNDIDCDDGDDTSGPEVEWWFDGDGDGYGAGATVGPQCDPPGIDSVPVFGIEDCEDGDSSINPGAFDECGDGIDTDCNGNDGGLAGCLSDTCAEAEVKVPIQFGSQSFIVNLTAYADDLGNPGCVDSTTGNADAFVPVTIAPGDILVASADSVDDTYVALVESCTAANSCLLGIDRLATGVEEVAYENLTGSPLEAFVVVGCSDTAGCADVDVDVAISSPNDYRADACPAAAPTPFATGAYRMSIGWDGLNNSVDIGAACTGGSTAGVDAQFPVTLEPGERIRAITSGGFIDVYGYIVGVANSVYLLEECGVAGTCLDGDTVTGTADVSYTNATASPQTLTLGFECAQAPYGYYYYYYYGIDCFTLEADVLIDTP